LQDQARASGGEEFLELAWALLHSHLRTTCTWSLRVLRRSGRLDRSPLCKAMATLSSPAKRIGSSDQDIYVDEGINALEWADLRPKFKATRVRSKRYEINGLSEI
jgi:hypothetical protein